jgi:hypothetical protein
MISPFIVYLSRLQKFEKRDGAAPLQRQHGFVIVIVRREVPGAISSEELFA